MGKCLPGMPCYETIVYTTYPKGCATSEASPFSLPLSSDNVIYTGPNLPYTGIQTDTDLTESLQRIDDKVGAIILEPVLLFTSVEISSAQLLANTDIDIISAPGAGKYIFILRVDQIFTYIAPAYTMSGGTPSWRLEYDGGSSAGTAALSATFTGTSTIISSSSNSGINGATTNYEDKKIVYSNNGTGALITGSGTIKLNITYQILDF